MHCCLCSAAYCHESLFKLVDREGVAQIKRRHFSFWLVTNESTTFHDFWHIINYTKQQQHVNGVNFMLTVVRQRALQNRVSFVSSSAEYTFSKF